MAKKKSLYNVHPGVTMVQNWVATLKEKSGRSLEEWVEYIKAEGPAEEKERREWLKGKHKLGTNTAWWLAERAEGTDTWDDDPEKYLQAAEDYVEAMFAGPKAGLRPIYDELLRLGLSRGKDVKACPCKTIVPLYRNHVFAEIKPATRTRIDFGLALKDTKPKGRLLDTGGFAKKDRITHRFTITRPGEIDDEVKCRLQAAYEMDG